MEDIVAMKVRLQEWPALAHKLPAVIVKSIPVREVVKARKPLERLPIAVGDAAKRAWRKDFKIEDPLPKVPW